MPVFLHDPIAAFYVCVDVLHCGVLTTPLICPRTLLEKT